jgi:uncharacterized protein
MNKSSLIIVGICVVAFFIQLALPIFEDTFLLVSSEVFARPWILITSMFLHGDFLHLLYNMLILSVFGIVLEKIIGTKNFLMVYFFGGLVSGIAVTLFYPAALGASGAIMAVMGTLAVLRPKMRSIFYGMPMAAAAVFLMIVDFFGLFAPSGVANSAHLGGMILGLTAGLYLKKQYGEKPQRKVKQIPEGSFSNWEDKWM